MKKRQGSMTAALVAVLVLVLLAASAYLGVSALAARRTAQGESHLKNGQYAEALEMLQDAEKYGKFTLRKNPRVTEAIAESYFGLEDYASALEYYVKVALSDPNNSKAAFRLGIIYINEKNYEKAGDQIKALEAMKTFEANAYAEELSDLLRENSIKGVFKDIYDKLAPKIPGLGDGLDKLKEKLLPDSGEEKPESQERDSSSPDSGSKTEAQIKNGTGVDI